MVFLSHTVRYVMWILFCCCLAVPTDCSHVQMTYSLPLSVSPDMDHLGHCDLPTPVLHFKKHFSYSLHHLSRGENHPSRLPKQPGHPMISDSFSSNKHVAHTVSNGCACLLLCMCRHMWGNVCTCYKHCISSCKQQAIKPTSPEPPLFSWTMWKLISCLPPLLVLWISEWRLTPEVVYSMSEEKGKVSYVWLCVCVRGASLFIFSCRRLRPSILLLQNSESHFCPTRIKSSLFPTGTDEA